MWHPGYFYSLYLSLTTPICILQTAVIHRRIYCYHLPRILFLISVHYSSALKPIQRMHHGQTAPTGLEAVCLSKITSRLSAFPPSFIYNSAPKLHVRRRPVCSHEILRGRWKIGGCSKPPQQPASCWCTEEERWDGPSLWSLRPLAPNPLILLSFLRLFFFFFFPISSAEVVCVSPCYFAALLSLDSRLISIQHLCWHKKATHWLLFFFFFSLSKHRRETEEGGRGRESTKQVEKEAMSGGHRGNDGSEGERMTDGKGRPVLLSQTGHLLLRVNKSSLICSTLTFLRLTPHLLPHSFWVSTSSTLCIHCKQIVSSFYRHFFPVIQLISWTCNTLRIWNVIVVTQDSVSTSAGKPHPAAPPRGGQGQLENSSPGADRDSVSCSRTLETGRCLLIQYWCFNAKSSCLSIVSLGPAA